MSLILAGIQVVSIYLDDVVVHAPSIVLHDTRLEQVLHHGFTLNSEKCMFGVEEVVFLGFRLSKEDSRHPAVFLPGDGRLLPQIHATLL